MNAYGMDDLLASLRSGGEQGHADVLAYVESVSLEELVELREEIKRHADARELVAGQDVFLLIGASLWCVCIEERIEDDPWGPIVESHRVGYASLRVSHDELLDAHYRGPDGSMRLAVRVADSVGYILRAIDGHPDPRVVAVTAC